MKRWFLRLGALCLALLLPFAAYFAWVQSKPAVYSTSIMGTMRYKKALIQETEGPRLILAGGSSVPYGTNCEYLAGELGINCINIGSTVYLGLDFYLNLLEKYMRPGDTVVIIPERVMLEGNERGYQMVWSAIENYPEMWELVPLDYWPGLVRGFHEYSVSKLDLLADGRDIPDRDAHSSEFGPLGDVTMQRESLLENGYNTDDLIALDGDTLNDEVVRKLNRFYKKAETMGVRVFFGWASVDELALTTGPEDWAALEARVNNELDMPVLGTLEAAIMPGEYFYNSNNHLTSEGALIYSALLAEYLSPYIDGYAPG